MIEEYSTEICNALEEKFRDAELHRPMRIGRYDPGKELVYDVTAVEGKSIGRVRLKIEDFVGGGFAGQVYRVRAMEMHAQEGPVGGLEKDGIYAMKILIPPSGFSRVFRNALYWVGFQGPFQPQINPAAARAGALWQKFIRRGAKIRFGDESTVVDIHATFVDNTLGSCGELSEWVDGRTWRLEVDDRLDFLKQWQKGQQIDNEYLGSPEYRAKYEFMHKFVELLHDMGGHEFARQYEWYTCKSQPNCLKRNDAEDNPSGGPVAVDFRAGLALLPFLPMSPGDFKLILNGVGRGSLVQFDRGNIGKLERFMDARSDDFAEMRDALDELKTCEQVYRNSIPDLSHNLFRLFYSRQLWSTILDSAVTGWQIQNTVDSVWAQKLKRNRPLTLLLFIIGMIPFLGTAVRRILCQTDWRKHYKAIFSSWDYFKRALRGKIAEKAIVWHRAGRVDEGRALVVSKSSLRFVWHSLLSILPVGLHKFITDWQYAGERLDYIFARPIRLYFNTGLREEWLRDMVTEGREKQMVSDGDASIILSQIEEPFIQKYLKSLAVHVCTLPVTQVVSVAVAVIYVAMHPEMPRAQAWGIGLGIIALFQVVPISPGSLVRGLYVVYLVVKERNFKDYNIAVFLGFFKYIGYLAFPIQMTYRYPVLARFMAGHWANESVHIVPVFGESGALLEHWVFCLFYNWPLTIRRRIRKRMELRRSMKKRYWHIGVCAILASMIFGLADFAYLKSAGELPDLKTLWWLTLLVPTACGALVTLGCGGAEIWKRIIGAVICGLTAGIFYTAATAVIGHGVDIVSGDVAAKLLWRLFLFSMLSSLGAILTELNLADPDLAKIN